MKSKDSSYKILVIYPSVVLSGGGNIAQEIINNALRRTGNRVYTVSFCGEYPVSNRKDHFTIDIIGRKKSKVYKYIFSLELYNFLKKILKLTSPDLVIIGQYWGFLTIIVLIIVNKLKVYHTAHAADLFCLNSMLTKKNDLSVCNGGPGIKCIRANCESITTFPIKYFLNIFSKFSIKNIFDGVICHSKFMEDYLMNVGIKKVINIPLYIEFNLETKTTIKRRKETEIIFIGALEWHKGIKETIYAIQKFTKVNQEIILHVIGNGSLRTELEEYCRSNLILKYVEFHGVLSREDVISYYKTSDIVIFPSYFESFGLVALEAIKALKFLIVSDRGALPEIVEEYPNIISLTTITPISIYEALIKANEMINNINSNFETTYSRMRTDTAIKKILSLE